MKGVLKREEQQTETHADRQNKSKQKGYYQDGQAGGREFRNFIQNLLEISYILRNIL
jgi:hypothetical protein